MIQFDLFTRPTETLEVRKEHIVTPRGGSYAGVAVVVAPSTTRAAAQSGTFFAE